LTGRIGAVLLQNPILPILLVVLPVFAVLVPGFASERNLQILLLQSSVLAVLVIGQSIVLITGNFDLSQEGTLVFTVMLSAWLMTVDAPGAGIGLNPVLALLIAVLAGGVIGAINGTVVERFGVNPFIVTLAMLLALRGLASVITGTQSIFPLPDLYSWVGAVSVAGFSAIVIVAGVIYSLSAVWLRTSLFGRHVFAVGGDKAASHENGISAVKVITGAFVLSGILAAIAGWLAASRLDSASPRLGEGIIFSVFAAAVIGGVSLKGGRGGLWGALGGVILLVAVENVLSLSGVQPLYVSAIRGFVILAVVLIDVGRQRLAHHLGIQEKAA
jgi:ribose/xylose/arabinose/galactoside ABC-type transport system permease subunit